MFVRSKSTPNSPRRSVQVVEARRNGSKVQQFIIRHVGIAMDAAEEQELRRLGEVILAKLEAERSETLPLFAPEELVGTYRKRGRRPGAKLRDLSDVKLLDLVEEQRVIEGIGEVFSPLFDELGFTKVLAKDHKVLEATVLARIANPVSKRRTAALLEQDYGIKLPLDRIYRMMDELYERRTVAQDVVRNATLALLPSEIDVVFFDVTTLYFESVTEDALRGFGYSKDQKFHMTQVVLALATTNEGLPVGYRLFHGATAEVKTLLECLKDWQSCIKIGKVALVADRAMMSEANLLALEEANIEYVIGASLRKQSAELRKQIFDEYGYVLGHIEDDFTWVNEYPVGDKRRLITAYSPRRAQKDASDRKRIIDKLTRRLGKQPQGALKRLISNRGYLKYTSTQGNASAIIDEVKVAADAEWDGMYGVITNAKDDRLSLLARYRRLWTIEEAFRISKHDLAMRPVFHFKPERIEAHVCICYLAYALWRHAQLRVRLRQRGMSVEQIQNELLRVQTSILRDKRHGGLYRIPSRMSEAQKTIYRAFDIKRSDCPSAIAL
jgi:transposase